MGPADAEAVRLLRDRLLARYQDWAEHLVVDMSGILPTLTLVLPHCRDHELFVEISRTETTVACNDRIPPGPAEAVFVWRDAPLEKGLDSVCEHIAGLVRGTIILVRERLPRIVQFARGHDCDSLLRFVPIDDFEGWSARRRRQILRAWTWDEAAQLAI